MYKIIGVDGREYGPAELASVRQWIAEGRINAHTRMQAAGSMNWVSAAEIPEINALLAPSFLPPPAPGSEAPLLLGPQATTRSPQKKGLAVTSFVLGVASFALCLLVLAGVPAIVCGQVARNRARRLPAEHGGVGLAVAGMVLGYLSVVYTLLIAVMSLPSFTNAQGHSRTTQCTSHMKQIGLALRVWGVDHDGQFPFHVSTNAGGTRELCVADYEGFDRDPAVHFAVIARELGAASVLICPLDRGKRPADNFERLRAGNVSYLLRTGGDVTDTNLNEILLKCPAHGTVLRCDGSVEVKRQGRRVRL